MTEIVPTQTLGPLARQEIRTYLMSKLFWLGAALLGLVSIMSIVDGGEPEYGVLFNGLFIAAALGVPGIVVMAGMTRRSDQLAAVAGGAAVSQRTRTLALASAAVVPFAAGLVVWVATLVSLEMHPPTAPFDGVSDAHLYAAVFGQGVMASVGGPLLGLVLGRWLPQRGVAPLTAVVMVLITILMQGNFESTWRWREVWVWTHWFGPVGWNSGEDLNVLLPGSPYLWVAYLAALCVLGVLVALYRDAEADRKPLSRAVGATVAVAAALVVLSMLGGLDEAIIHTYHSS